MPRHTTWVAHLILTAVLGLLGSPLLAAQESRGSIGGRVVDSSGGVLPGVTVTIVNNGTNATSVVVTGEGGVFTAPFLTAGQLPGHGGAPRLPDHGSRNG